MSTNFTPNPLSNGQTIDAAHVNRYVKPINDLESGAALFRAATNVSGAYSVDFKATANPNGHRITSLTQGQMIVFKASHNSPASATLRVELEPSGTATHPLYMADTPVGANDILQNQMVMAVYNATTTPRFDVIGVARGGGALSELEDVTFTSLATGQLLRYNGTAWVNATLAAGDLPSHTHATTEVTGLPNILEDIENLQTALAGVGDFITSYGTSNLQVPPGGWPNRLAIPWKTSGVRIPSRGPSLSQAVPTEVQVNASGVYLVSATVELSIHTAELPDDPNELDVFAELSICILQNVSPPGYPEHWSSWPSHLARCSLPQWDEAYLDPNAPLNAPEVVFRKIIRPKVNVSTMGVYVLQPNQRVRIEITSGLANAPTLLGYHNLSIVRFA